MQIRMIARNKCFPLSAGCSQTPTCKSPIDLNTRKALPIIKPLIDRVFENIVQHLDPVPQVFAVCTVVLTKCSVV